MTDPNHLTREQVTALLKARVTELGGLEKAKEIYGVSIQLISMVQRGERRPNAAMLKDLKLKHIEVPASEHWEPMGEGEE